MRARLESLESALGSKLFTRSVRGLVPTAQAMALGEAARGMPGAPEELNRHDLIGPDRSAMDLEAIAQVLPDIDRQHFTLRMDSHPAQLAAVQAGLGRAIGDRNPTLRSVLPDFAIGALETWIVMHEDLRDMPRVRAVFDHLAAEFDAYGKG